MILMLTCIICGLYNYLFRNNMWVFYHNNSIGVQWILLGKARKARQQKNKRNSKYSHQKKVQPQRTQRLRKERQEHILKYQTINS